jgi:hypothetical protein
VLKDFASEELGTSFILRRTKVLDGIEIGNRQNILLGGRNVNSVNYDAQTMSYVIATLSTVLIDPCDYHGRSSVRASH